LRSLLSLRRETLKRIARSQTRGGIVIPAASRNTQGTSGRALATRTACYGVVLALFALLAPAAAAKEKSSQAKFEFSVSGSQTTIFSRDDPGCAGSGSEEVTFATATPLRVTAVRLKQGPFFNFGLGETPTNANVSLQPFNVGAVVHRTLSWTSTENCIFESTRSCDATLETSWQLNIWSTPFEDNTVQLLPADESADDPFSGSCPHGDARGIWFPYLPYYDPVTYQPLVKGPLSEKALFPKKKGKKQKELTSEGQGSYTSSLFGSSSTTTTNWTVELKRIK
jgi:hypothetical protein